MENQDQDTEAEAATRLRDLLARPLPPHEAYVGSAGYFDPWDAFDGIVGAYNSDIDQMAIETLVAVRDGKTFDLLQGEHKLFVEFFLHILSGHDYVDYGISPRGAFPAWGTTDKLMDAWIEKWEAWYRINWREEPV